VVRSGESPGRIRTSPELLLLSGERELLLGRRLRRLLHLVGAAPNDDDGATRCERLERLQDVAEERFPAERMEDLRRRGLESLALAGGEDDRGEGTGFAGHAAQPEGCNS
jgi:hypothetical protein